MSKHRTLSYDEIVKEIEKCPTTWLPSLLCVVTDRCTIEKVFTPGGLLHAVGRWEKDAKRHERIKAKDDTQNS